MPELVFFRRGEEMLRVNLERQRMVLGSGQRSDIILPDPLLSPQHVALRHDGTRCLLEDLSGQGILVSGRLMMQGELLDGVDLALGQWRAVFRQRSSGNSSRSGQRTDVQPRDSLKDSAPAQLRIKQGSTELLHELGEGSFTLGTSEDNAVVIEDPFVSSQHLQVTRSPDGFRVRDLNSTNGTFLGPVRLFDAEVPLNTVLRVGDTELIFELTSQATAAQTFHGILGTDPAVRQLVEFTQRLAAVSAPVLLLGESGTGKELVARALHTGSPRADRQFVPINCAAISPALMESELFGHTKGAFTGAVSKRQGAFEEAQGGTLFLDEVGELPMELQAKLLRVLESGEIKPVGTNRTFRVDARVVAATHRDLPARVSEGKFREDLYYRLCVIPVVLPPLRSRRGDLRLLVEHFLRAHAPSEQMVSLAPEALSKLQQHPWPGNVRELRNVVHRALLQRQGSRIEARDIVFEPQLHPAPEPEEVRPLELPEGVNLEQMLRRLERELILSTLMQCNNNKEQTARRLGLARASLFKRLKEWGVLVK